MAEKSTSREHNSTSKEKNEIYYVGIGTSAGGLEALQHLFDHYTPRPNVAIIIVQHLSPDYKSLMVELLSKHTSMQVNQVTNGIKVEGNCVYVMPARKDLTIKGGKLFLKEKDPLLNINFPIDIFLHSLGDDQKEKAIAVILSGTGTDGSRGIKTIKEKGGIVMVQDTHSAKFNGMPLSAISTKQVDYVLPPHEIAIELENIATVRPADVARANLEVGVSSSHSLAKILGIVNKTTGLDFSFYKRNTIFRRIERRMKLNKIDEMENYYHYLSETPKEVHNLQKDLLIGVTQFFRDKEAFEELEKLAIPKIFESKLEDEAIRIWTPGCSTGEEAYSTLILFEEFRKKHNRKNPIKLFATDIDSSAIEQAGNGIYPVNIAADVSKERLAHFFTQREHAFHVNQDIRNQVVFARHNILSDPPFNRVDLIVCRNLLIYLETVLQKKVLSTFQFSLNRNGFLFLGPSESVGELSRMLQSVEKRWKIYQNKAEPRTFIPDMLMNPLPPAGPQIHYQPGIPPVRNTIKDQRVDMFRDILVDKFTPMVAFVNQEMETLYLSGGINQVLRLPEKKLSLNFLKMLPEELIIPLSTASRKVIKDKKAVRYNSIQVTGFDGETTLFDLQVEWVAADINVDSVLLVSLFKQESSSNLEGEKPIPVNEMAVKRIEFLEQQLKDTRENLQSTIEELETSNEELQASNEELMAANEELQSTNEELQSVNEELHTVNSELQVKITEMTTLTNDMDNLLKSTEIGTIFLDKEMRIRKFTPAIHRQFNLIERDLGRPISHFNTDLGGVDIVSLSRQVLTEEKRLVTEVQLKSDQTFVMRILPYKTDESKIEGVVITFIDVGEIKKETSIL